MVQKRTYLKVSDNSGAKYCLCIGLYKNKKIAKIGDIILVSIKKMHKNIKSTTLYAGKVCKAVVIRTKCKFTRGENTYAFFDNAVAIVDNQYAPLGNRIFGMTVRLDNQRYAHYSQITNIAEKTL